ncbi:hypothetical protein BH11ARM2_BH11ARM2_08010 [soil metagenome]
MLSDQHDSVLVTEELDRRPFRAPDYEAENEALRQLMEASANAPESLLQKLVEVCMAICGAESAVLSTEATGSDGEKVLCWQAATGEFAPYRGKALPPDGTPGGFVIGSGEAGLFERPGRCYPEIAARGRELKEVLIAPFFEGGRATGALWVGTHGGGRPFDGEDRRLLERLAGFAALAWRAESDRLGVQSSEERLRAALREAEIERTRLHTLIRMSPSAIAFIRGEDLRFEYANDACFMIVGRNDIVGKPLLEALPEIQGQGFAELLRQVMQTGEPFSHPEAAVLFRPDDGEPDRAVYVDLHFQPLREDDGEVSGVFVHAVDVTDQVRARTEVLQLADSLKRQTSLWDAALSNIADNVWVFDREVRFRYANQTLLHLWGLAFEAIVGKTCEEMDYPPEVAAQLRRDTEGVFLTGGRVAGEVDYTSPTGESGHFEYVMTPVVNSDGVVEAVAGSSHNVGERRQAEIERERLLAELAKERGKLDSVLNLSPSFVTILKGKELRFEYANPAYGKAVGRYDLVGRTLAEAMPEVVSGGSQGQEYDRFLLDVMENGKTITFTQQPIQLETTPGNLEERILDFTYQSLREPDGQTSVLVHGTDITERARAERALAEREELFRTVFEQAPDDAIIVMDLDRTLTAWNPAAERITGWSAEEAIGHHADLIFTPEDTAAGVPALETQTAARLDKAADERWHMRKDGTRFWGSGTMNSLHDVDGNVRGYLKVFRDGTDQYEEVRTLAFLRRLAETVIELRDADAIIQSVERMLGEHLGASRVLFAEATADGMVVNVRQDWTNGVASLVGSHRVSDFGPQVLADFEAGKVHVSRNGERDYALGEGLESIRAIQAGAGISLPVLKEGRFSALVVVHQSTPRDWTEDEIALVRQVADRVVAEVERARAETALRASEERFRAAQETNPDPFTIMQAVRDGSGELVDFRWTFVNEATGRLTGETAEDLVGALVSNRRPGIRSTALYKNWRHTAETGEPFSHESFMDFPSGRTFLRLTGVRVGDGVATSFTDLTQRQLNEERLELAVSHRTAQLQAAVKEAEGFNYSISHDLRAPIRAIASTSSILLEDLGPTLSAEDRNLLERQLFNAKRLGTLIDELLRLSRYARVEVKRQPLDMTEMALSVAEEIGGDCHVEVQEGMTAEGDPGLVRTVLRNLIGNACKFSSEGDVWVGQEGKAFFVRDEGIGFDMVYAPKLFLPFERLVSEAEFPGTGIGLANVKRIVERHGGKVWAEAEPRRGATFSFTLG